MSHEQYHYNDTPATPEQISKTMADMARTLILRGRISENTDGMPYIQRGDRIPYAFSYTIGEHDAQTLLSEGSQSYNDIDNTTISLRYTTPYRIGTEAPDDQPTTSVSVEITGKIYPVNSSKPQTEVSQFYLINNDTITNELTATVTSDYSYSKKDQSLNRKNTEPTILYGPDDVRNYAETIESINESTRELTKQDLDDLIWIINYVDKQPPITEA